MRAAQALAMIGVSAGGRTLAMTCTAPGPPPIGCPPDGPSVPGGADIAAASSKSLVVVDLTIRISLASYFSLRAKSRLIVSGAMGTPSSQAGLLRPYFTQWAQIAPF